MASGKSNGSMPGPDEDGLITTCAKCKWFNVAKGFGFVSFDDQANTNGEGGEGKQHPDIFVHQSAIKMKGFRSLREGEQVEICYKKSDKGLEAIRVSGPGGVDCKGSEKRPKGRKKGNDRCYNCDERAHHAKECKLPPLPKRCHHCKSVDHLVADCTLKRDKGNASSSGTKAQEKSSKSNLSLQITGISEVENKFVDCSMKEKPLDNLAEQSTSSEQEKLPTSNLSNIPTHHGQTSVKTTQRLPIK